MPSKTSLKDNLRVTTNHGTSLSIDASTTYIFQVYKKRQDSTGSDDTASMITSSSSVRFLCTSSVRFSSVQRHAQSLAATNRVTEQFSWQLRNFFMSCSISWMASIIDNLYLLDLVVVLVIN